MARRRQKRSRESGAPPAQPQPAPGRRRLPGFGAHAAAAGVLLVAVLVVWWAQRPVSVWDLNSDMHNICAVAAGKGDPGRYASDPHLGDRKRLDRYIPFYVGLVQAAKRVAGGYPEGVWLLVLPTALLFAGGCYLLFWRFTGSHLVGVGFALAFTFARIWFQLGEKWSMCEVWGVMPRTQYTAFVPWLLLAMWEVRHRTRWWPGVAALAGVLIYLYPLSAPVWGVAVWCGLVLATGDGVSRRSRLRWGAIAGAAALLVASPGLYGQLRSRLPSAERHVGRPEMMSEGAKEALARQAVERAEQAQELQALRESRYSPGLMNLREGFGLVWEDIAGDKKPPYRHRWMAVWGVLWALAGIGLGVWHPPSRRALLMVGVALLAFMLITVAAPLVEGIRANAAGRKPTWYDLARGIRFWPFWLAVVGAAGFGILRSWSADRRWGLRWGLARLVPLLAVGTVWAAFWLQISDGAGQYFGRDSRERAKRAAAAAEVIAFIREHTAQDAPFAVSGNTFDQRNDFWLRHTPGRPVVHSWKEGTTLSGNYQAAVAWKKREEQEGSLRSRDVRLLYAWRELAAKGNQMSPEDRDRMRALVGAAEALWRDKLRVWQEWGAEYALQPAWGRPPRPISVEFENNYWYVARVPKPAGQTGRAEPE